jgi:hypothetical protein
MEDYLGTIFEQSPYENIKNKIVQSSNTDPVSLE